MAFGFGFGFARNYVSALFSAFSPASLFTDGAPGVWYDPSDYTTLFQDSAGTTPVTAVEQPVGLMLDKSQGLVLGPELVTNGTFDSGTTGWSADANCDIVVVGGYLEMTQKGSGYARTTQSMTTVVGRSYQLTGMLYAGSGSRAEFLAGTSTGGAQLGRTGAVLANTPTAARLVFRATSTTTFISAYIDLPTVGLKSYFDNISVKELPGNHAFQSTSASRPVLSARVNKLLATATLATQSVTTRATAHTLRFEGAGTVTLTGTAIGVYTAGTHSITTTAGTLTLTVVGSVTSADLRETNDGVGLPVYQAVVTSTNYTTTGFLPYLKFDGVDDGMSTNSISFTSTDKMSVFAGVRKLSDQFIGSIAVISTDVNANAGTFWVFAPNGDRNTNWNFRSRGTTGFPIATQSGKPAPDTAVLTGIGNISGDITQLRYNGVLAATDTADQGTGNYGNYPLYVGRRGGTTLPFNGQMYSMIIVGKAVTAGELSSTETYVNQKTGAY